MRRCYSLVLVLFEVFVHNFWPFSRLIFLVYLLRVWGTFLADIVIQMLGTDYIRILQAINVFSQVPFVQILSSKRVSLELFACIVCQLT